MKIHHLGIVCKNVEKAVENYGLFFTIVNKSKTVYDPLQDAYLCLVETDNGLNVEFISGNQVSKLPKGISYYHVCYQVDDIDKTILEFEAKGAVLVSSPKQAILFNGKRVAFMLLKSGLIEFVEL